MMENSRFLIIIFYFEGKKKEINTNLRCFFSLRLLSPVPTPAIRLGVFSVNKSHSSSQRIASAARPRLRRWTQFSEKRN